MCEKRNSQPYFFSNREMYPPRHAAASESKSEPSDIKIFSISKALTQSCKTIAFAALFAHICARGRDFGAQKRKNTQKSACILLLYGRKCAKMF